MKTVKRTTRKETRTESVSVERVEENDTDSAGLPIVLPHEATPQDEHWTYLSEFFMQFPPTAGSEGVPRAKVFANGRQRLPIRVILSPRNERGDFVCVPEAQLRRELTLVDSGNLLPLPAGWSVEQAPNEYNYDDTLIPNAAGTSNDDYAHFSNKGRADLPPYECVGNTIKIMIYVTVQANANLTPVVVVASARPPGASQSITTRPGTPGAPGNGFDSQVNVVPRATPTIEMDVGEISDGMRVKMYQRYNNKWARGNEWYLSLYLQNRSVELRSLSYDVNPCMWWDTLKWGPWKMMFVLASQPGTSLYTTTNMPPNLATPDYEYNSPITAWYDQLNLFVPVRGVLSFIAINSSEDYNFHDFWWQPVAENWSTSLYVRDEFGNSYPLRAEINRDTPDQLLFGRWSGREAPLLHGPGERQGIVPYPTARRTKSETTETRETKTHIVETVEEYTGGPDASFTSGIGFPWTQLANPDISRGIGRTPRRRLPRDTTPWTRLSAFRLEPVASKSPGQIRTRVKVTLSAWNADGKQVTIPDDELETILTLVDHETGEPLSNEWTITHATEPVDPPDEPQRAGGRAVQTFEFWVTGTVSCPAPLRVAASIYPPDGSAPIQTRPGYSDGDIQFDGWVDLNTKRDRLWTISTLDLTRESTSDKVFGNGMQQIRFKVELGFTDRLTGLPGIPDDALDTIGIALFDESTPLPISPVSTGWFTTPGVSSSTDLTHFHGYDSYPEFVAVNPVDVGSPRASAFRYFYVACSGEQATRIKLCAYVKCRDGWLYTGNNKAFDDCGHEETGHPGKFEEVSSIAPEDATINQFPWEFDTLPGGNGSADEPPTNPDTVRRYTLSYTDKRGNAAGIRYLQIAPEFPLPPEPPEGKSRSAMIQWHDQVPGEHRACFTGYAPPGSTTLVWDETLPDGTPVPLPTLPSANKRAAVVLLVGRQNIPFTSGMQKGPLTLTATDWYGTTSTLRLSFESGMGDGRWKLVLSK